MFVGIDSHKDTVAVCAIDENGRVVAQGTFANSPAGHRRFLRWLDRLGKPTRIGIEGSGYYAATLARGLVDAGYPAREVPSS